MIAVIADDLTGAAELAGIALRFNRSAEICLDVPGSSKADVLIIATDTRSGSESEAVEEMVRVTKKVASLHPELIFKKIDSVLRGHVYAETECQLATLNIGRAILVPANPDLGRTLVNGIYFIQGKPIADTSFCQDPEFPIRNSDVVQMLRAENKPLQILRPGEKVSGRGIIVAEVESAEDLKEWAGYSSKEVLMAGGSGLFKAVLEMLTGQEKAERSVSGPSDRKKILYISGTAFSESAALVKEIHRKDGPVCYMPLSVLKNAAENTELESWADQVADIISERFAAILAIDPATVDGSYSASELRKKMAMVVERVFRKAEINELLIEGGSTASAVFRSLNINTLYPKTEYALGIIRCLSDKADLYVTLKPGSYKWPSEVWMF